MARGSIFQIYRSQSAKRGRGARDGPRVARPEECPTGEGAAGRRTRGVPAVSLGRCHAQGKCWGGPGRVRAVKFRCEVEQGQRRVRGDVGVTGRRVGGRTGVPGLGCMTPLHREYCEVCNVITYPEYDFRNVYITNIIGYKIYTYKQQIDFGFRLTRRT